MDVHLPLSAEEVCDYRRTEVPGQKTRDSVRLVESQSVLRRVVVHLIEIERYTDEPAIPDNLEGHYGTLSGLPLSSEQSKIMEEGAGLRCLGEADGPLRRRQRSRQVAGILERLR